MSEDRLTHMRLFAHGPDVLTGQRLESGFILHAKMTHCDFFVSRLIQNPSASHIFGRLKHCLGQPARSLAFRHCSLPPVKSPHQSHVLGDRLLPRAMPPQSLAVFQVHCLRYCPVPFLRSRKGTLRDYRDGRRLAADNRPSGLVPLRATRCLMMPPPKSASTIPRSARSTASRKL